MSFNATLSSLCIWYIFIVAKTAAFNLRRLSTLSSNCKYYELHIRRFSSALKASNFERYTLTNPQYASNSSTAISILQAAKRISVLDNYKTANIFFLSTIHKLSAPQLSQLFELVEGIIDKRGSNEEFEPDIKSLTKMMASACNLEMYDSVVDFYSSIDKAGLEYDPGMLMMVVRALGYVRPWNESISLLDLALKRFGNESIKVANEAIITLKYAFLSQKGHKSANQLVVSRLQNIRQWFQINDLALSSDSICRMLSVGCKFGSYELCEDIFDLFSLNNISPTLSAYNMRLDRCSECRNETRAREILFQMIGKEIEPDRITFNTLLKICHKTGNITWAKEVIEEMKQRGIPLDDVAYSFIILINKFEKSSSIFDILSTVPPEQLSEYVFCNAISSSDDSTSAISLLQHAKDQGLSNYVVYLSAASALINQGDSTGAFNILQDMFSTGIGLNRDIMQFIVKTCVTRIQSNPKFPDSFSSFKILFDYLFFAKQTYPHVLDSALFFSVTKAFLQTNQPFLAMGTQRIFFREFVFPNNLMPTLFNSLESYRLANLSSVSNYLFVKEESDENVSSNSAKFYLLHHNLNLAKEEIISFIDLYLFMETNFRANEKKFRCSMSSSSIDTLVRIFTKRYSLDDVRWLMESISGTRGTSLMWKPTGVTLFEFADYFRRHCDIEFSYKLLDWACSFNPKDKVHIPESIVNAILAFLYKEGRKELVLELFDKYKTKRRDKAWKLISEDRTLILDLHYKSRGMAYALLLSAIQYLSCAKEFLNLSSLVIITGTNTASTKGNSSDKVGQVPKESFRLSTEVQQLLIEEFYPPIPSSTERGNPGRLIVQFADIRKFKKYTL